jgi:hypothetical protein
MIVKSAPPLQSSVGTCFGYHCASISENMHVMGVLSRILGSAGCFWWAMTVTRDVTLEKSHCSCYLRLDIITSGCLLG